MVRNWLGLPHVSGTSLCFQGWECSSSPTSGTVFSLFRGFLASDCAHFVHLFLSGAFFYWWPVLWPVASFPSLEGTGRRSLPVHGGSCLGQHDL